MTLWLTTCGMRPGLDMQSMRSGWALISATGRSDSATESARLASYWTSQAPQCALPRCKSKVLAVAAGSLHDGQITSQRGCNNPALTARKRPATTSFSGSFQRLASNSGCIRTCSGIGAVRKNSPKCSPTPGSITLANPLCKRFSASLLSLGGGASGRAALCSSAAIRALNARSSLGRTVISTSRRMAGENRRDLGVKRPS